MSERTRNWLNTWGEDIAAAICLCAFIPVLFISLTLISTFFGGPQ